MKLAFGASVMLCIMFLAIGALCGLISWRELRAERRRDAIASGTVAGLNLAVAAAFGWAAVLSWRLVFP